MQTCAPCGRENPDDARFCNGCGGPLAEPPPAEEQRKTVTVLFADVSGSTRLGERLDPESLRRVLARFFDVARQVIERHGGTVEKFIGDAVMAVFGVPVLHEDDALRAVRAAAGLQDAVAALNADLTRQFQTSLQVRIGVNTGEVVTGTQERLATGDAVNVAARLEQHAAPGEVLLGGTTFSLVRDKVVAVEQEPVAAKGKAAPVAAHRLVAVEPVAAPPARRRETPMVGRSNQLALLAGAFAHAVRDRTCALFTVLGTAGVGKSRLAAEFLADVDATVVRGRCLSYGDGITYWPVVEVLKRLLAGPAAGLLEEDRGVAAAVAAVFGESAAAVSSADIAWAVRRLLERAAADRPLLVVFDDMHWGEPTFFDLVEHITDLSRDAPILLLCMGRPELLDRRPGWGGGKLNATTILLEPLDAAETDQLIRALQPDGIDERLRAKVRDAAAGNPLFAEEMLALVAASGAADVTVPPTIQALLAARLDQLDVAERRVLERGSVEGQSFHRGAVQALTPQETDIAPRLVSLVRKDLVRPDRSTLSGEEAFRFRHLLIRDAAYEGLPKAARAELHERFARWLDERAGDLVERDEIVGYHLEQAYRYRIELAAADETAGALAADAATRLQAAGRRAMDRGDMGAAIGLLERAARLHPREELEVSLELGIVPALLLCGRPRDGVELAQRLIDRAVATGDRVAEMRARLQHAGVSMNVDPSTAWGELQSVVDAARPVLEAAGDDAALATLWRAVFSVEHMRCRMDAAFEAATRGMEHARRSGQAWLERDCRFLAAAAVAFGSAPVEEALDWLRAAQEGSPVQDPLLDDFAAVLLAESGRIDEGKDLHAHAVAGMRERGMALFAAVAAQQMWEMETLAGDHAAAERAAREACDELEPFAEKSWMSTLMCEVGYSLTQLGRDDEAQEWARRGVEYASTEDVFTLLLGCAVEARVQARRGDARAALAAVDSLVRLAEGAQHAVAQGSAFANAASTLAALGRREDAAVLAERALATFAAKGATGWESRVRRDLASVLATSSS